MPNYSPTESKIYTGRHSARAEYVHQKIRFLDLDEALPKAKTRSLAILGYACDEGVRRNNGRPGAVEGPDHIRKQWGRLPLPIDTLPIADAGTIRCSDTDLESTQELLAEKINALLTANYFPIALGGGHDIAYGHFKGIHEFLSGQRTIGIVNFDAHLDLRDPIKGANSGTPFYQISRMLGSKDLHFHYLCAGMRPEASSQELIDRARALKVTVIPREGFIISELEEIRTQLLAFSSRVEYLYITIDMDGFASAFAPGVSAASPLGYDTDVVMASLSTLFETKKVIAVDIAETNPRYDRDDQTAKLAAGLMHHICQLV